MGSIPGVKDEIKFDGQTKIGGFRFQKYLKERIVHIHNPEDERVEYPIADFLKHTDKFMTRLRDLVSGEKIKLLDLSVEMLSSGKLELDVKGCKDSVDVDKFQAGMKEFIKLLEK